MWLLAATQVVVDFVILLKNGVEPEASLNIAGSDGETGFYHLCSETCPVTTVTNEDGSTSPKMRFCQCIAELLVEDLSTDFGALHAGVDFVLGDYRTAEEPSAGGSAHVGHSILRTLMTAAPQGAERAEERITVWIAGELPAGPGRHLEGSTYLNQPLYKGIPGAGVLLLSSVSRNGHRLSHEVGHIVGFHHTAGEQGLHYVYDTCGEAIQWFTLSNPTCELNIMGSWYDGPYCCPHGGDTAECLPRQAGVISQPYCCGASCQHTCNATRPEMTFATAEHTQLLHDVTACWVSLVGHEPPSGYTASHKQSLLVYTEDLSSSGTDEDMDSLYMEDVADEEDRRIESAPLILSPRERLRGSHEHGSWPHQVLRPTSPAL